MKTVLLCGTFDLFHIGHLNAIIRARQMGDRLVVAVSTDEFSFHKKGEYPIYNQYDRKEIVRAIKFVDEVTNEINFNCHKEIIDDYGINIGVWGADWDNGTFDHLDDWIDVVFITRTPNISTTQTKKQIKESET
jgi:glycerol-3-phosphate cytidylyltransferase